jgi:hypothetical protein
VESTTDLRNWSTNAAGVASQGINTHTNFNTTANAAFYRLARTALANYDPVTGSTAGGGQTITLTPNSASRGQNNISITAVISATANPPPPPHTGAPVQSFSIGSLAVTGASYSYNSGTGAGTVTGTVSIPSDAITGGQTVTITFSPPPGQQTGPVYAQENGFAIN